MSMKQAGKQHYFTSIFLSSVEKNIYFLDFVSFLERLLYKTDSEKYHFGWIDLLEVFIRFWRTFFF